MHVFLATRGINQATELWRDYMQAQQWSWLLYPLLKDEKGEYIKNPDGSFKHSDKPVYSRVQGALRPIQFWEYILPEKGFKVTGFNPDKSPIIEETENLPELFAMMNERKPWETRKEMAPLSWALRKLLHAKPIPEMKILQEKEPQAITEKFVPSNGFGVATYAIGIKNDGYGDLIIPDGKGGTIGHYQEFL